jgi:hypothetical protein
MVFVLVSARWFAAGIQGLMGFREFPIFNQSPWFWTVEPVIPDVLCFVGRWASAA